MTVDPRLILVEGLPGTGKTTLAEQIATNFRAAGENVDLFQEGDLQPCDHQWISRMSPSGFDAARAQLHAAWQRSSRVEPWSDIEARLHSLSVEEEGVILTAYTKLEFADRDLWDAIQSFRDAEIHDGRVTPRRYREIYVPRWQAFGTPGPDADVTVMECAFLQCHVTELLGHHGANDDEIIHFLAELIEPVQHLQPSIHYITATDYPACIRATGEARPGWLDSVIRWVESSPYGQANHLSGFDGTLQFFAHRSAIERRALSGLGVPVTYHQRP